MKMWDTCNSSENWAAIWKQTKRKIHLVISPSGLNKPPSTLYWNKFYFSWCFTAKFVVSCCVFCKLQRDFGFFCSMNHFSEGGVNANHNVTCTSSLADNDSRLLKRSEGNHNGEWIFCRRKEADVALFLRVRRMRKIIKICKANLTSQ